MNRRAVAVLVTVLTLVLIAVIGWLAYWRERTRADELATQRSHVCMGMESSLNWALMQARDPAPPHQHLHPLVRLHFTDQRISEMCLGVAIPVDTSDAGACWIKSHENKCWMPVLEELLELYRARPDRWR